jgi:hypothetical protein
MMPATRVESLPRLLFAALLALFTAAVFEAGVRWTGLDVIALRPLLYYQNSDLPVHELAPDPALLYRLKPGSRTTDQTPAGPVSFSVNALGFRDPPRAARKPAGVYRIVCVGISHMYGALVSDEETLPRHLEAVLNSRFRGRFEVWNAGVSAYVAMQEVAYARQIAARYDPDLILFQLDRMGRRAFLYGQPFAPYFRADPRLYLENLVVVPFGHNSFAAGLLAASALYRTAVIYLNYPFMLGPVAERQGGGYVLEANRRAVADYFTAREPGPAKAMLLFRSYDGWDPRLPAPPAIDLYASRFAPTVLPPEYFRIHPDSHVYRMQAQIIAEELAGLFPEALRKKDPSRSLVEAARATVPASRIDPDDARRICRAMRGARRFASLRSFMQDMVREHPEDASYRLALAEAQRALAEEGRTP